MLKLGEDFKVLIKDLIITEVKPTVLYNGSSNGTITLSDSVINYEYIEIFFRNNDSLYSSVKVYQANNKNVSLLTSFVSNNAYFVVKGAKVNISGNSITKSAHGEFNANGYAPVDWGNTTYITRVLGYKA